MQPPGLHVVERQTDRKNIWIILLESVEEKNDRA